MEVLKRLFEQHFQSPPERVQPLQGQLGGSGRVIVRLAGAGHTAIGILYSVREENVAFLEFSRHFRRHGLPVPQIYGEDLNHGAYLEEDLGDTTLFRISQRQSFRRYHRPASDRGLPQSRRRVLPRFQVEAGRDVNYKVCYPRASFDRQSIAWDLNYFKYYFLRLAGIPFNEQALELDFTRLTKFLLERRSRLLSLPRFPIAQHHAARRPALVSRLSRRPQRRVCNTILRRFSTMARPICRPPCATTTRPLSRLPRRFHQPQP